ncbi:MAG: hypothetical protein R3D62_02090 [Xanthobacteraceae bacterium]
MTAWEARQTCLSNRRLSVEKNLEDRVRQRAYFMWLDSDRGLDSTVCWLAAEREVLAEAEREAAASSPGLAAHQMARRVNALLLLESGPDDGEADLGVAAE